MGQKNSWQLRFVRDPNPLPRYIAVYYGWMDEKLEMSQTEVKYVSSVWPGCACKLYSQLLYVNRRHPSNTLRFKLYLVYFFSIFFLFFPPVDGEWTDVQGWGIVVLRLQTCLSCHALLWHWKQAFWENPHSACCTGKKQQVCVCLCARVCMRQITPVAWLLKSI